MSAAKAHRAGDMTLWLIGGFKLVKGLLLLAVALEALHLLHKTSATSRSAGSPTSIWTRTIAMSTGHSASSCPSTTEG